MKHARPAHPTAPHADDPLFQLELRVARRADELARSHPTGHSVVRDRQTWRQAESEFQELGALAQNSCE
jgi:hypothetical protein